MALERLAKGQYQAIDVLIFLDLHAPQTGCSRNPEDVSGPGVACPAAFVNVNSACNVFEGDFMACQCDVPGQILPEQL